MRDGTAGLDEYPYDEYNRYVCWCASNPLVTFQEWRVTRAREDEDRDF